MHQHVPTRRKFHSRVADSGNEIASVENEKCENSKEKKNETSTPRKRKSFLFHVVSQKTPSEY